MRWALALVAVAACGRVGFDPFEGNGDGGNGDGSVATPRCSVPARPDVSSPRVTLGCDQIIATQEVLTGGVIRFDCATSVNLGAPMLVNKDTIIDGHGVVFDGQGITQILRVNNNAHLTLLDVTLTRGAVADYGGAVRIDSGGLVAFDSTFSDNHGPTMGATIGGGAIAAQPPSATVEIYGGTLGNNTSANGGAIQIFGALTIVNARLHDNTATGTGGSTAQGGDGGAVQAVGNANMTLCGDTFSSNLAGANGGALDRIVTSGSTTDTVTDVSLDFNRAGGGGGAYIQQSSTLVMRRVSVTLNVANVGGGLWLQTIGDFDAENLSIVANRSDNGTGAGMFVSGTSGRLAFTTIADNLGACSGCVSSAIAGGQLLDFTGTVVVDNTAPATPVACTQSGNNSGANFQWPGDAPLCATAATVTDPFLLPRGMASGPAGNLLVRKPSSGSPAIGAVASTCPTEDVLGRPRPLPCAAGAVEP